MKVRDDNDYIGRVLSGDVSAYASLVAKHKNLVFSIVLKIVNNREDAEEISQDVFLKAYQSLSTFERKSKFSTWLYRIAYNAAISKTRKKKVEMVAIEETVITN
jgi:RNA polymerase sigma-70 factor (ECF subfamily)